MFAFALLLEHFVIPLLWASRENFLIRKLPFLEINLWIIYDFKSLISKSWSFI